MSDPQAWLRTARRRVFLDMHLPDWTADALSADDPARAVSPAIASEIASRLDPERIVAELRRAEVQAVVVFAKCQYGNYYADLPGRRLHTGLGGRDFLREMTAAAHASDIRVLAYYSSRWDAHAARLHPEWRQLDPDGAPTPGRWPSLCLSGPYRDRVREDLRSIVSDYDVDGIWLDMVHGAPCHAAYCREQFAEATGRPMPTSTDDVGYLELLRWQSASITGYLSSCREVVASAEPRRAFVVNYYGTTVSDAREGLTLAHLDLSDIGSTEGYSEWHGLLHPSFAARFLRMAAHDRPFEILVSRFANTWDYSVRPLAQLRFEAFTVAANAGAVNVDDAPYHDGGLEAAVYDQVAKVYDEIRHRTACLVDAQPVRYAAIYHSETSRLLDVVLGRPRQPSGDVVEPSDLNPGPSDLIPGVLGTFKALLESHLPVDLVDGAREGLDGLLRYRAVVVDNVLHLSDDEVDALEEYVRHGGGLVVTGGTALYDRDGRPREHPRFARLLGVERPRRGRFTYPYVCLGDNPLTRGLPTFPHPHYLGAWEMVVQAPDVKVAATRRDPIIETSDAVFFHNNLPPPGPDEGHPFIVYRQVGAGRIACCAGLPGSNVARFGLPFYRDVIAALVSWTAGEPPLVTCRAGSETELAATRVGDDLVVHLITGRPARAVRFGAWRTADTIDQIAQIGEVELLVHGAVDGAERMYPRERLALNDSDVAGVVRITLPSGSDWETIRVSLRHP
ncbi:MAG TPA: alpha-amylase family protein [Nocardioidaceae bacterium]|nr:alpha-amylase family protein [Nocardioidaceae bacterium]